ncbi:MAG: lytic transglycosylase domain-containing protein [Ignavibacteriales bacterium]
MSGYFSDIFSRLRLIELLQTISSMYIPNQTNTNANSNVKTPTVSTKKESFSDIIKNASETYGIDEKVIRAVIKNESSFNPSAVSHCGAQGLMQLMPSTAKSLGVTDSFDPEQNIMAGTKYLKHKLDEFGGDLKLALAAYNAGSGAVRKYGGVPPYKQTMAYVNKVINSIDYRA